MDEPRLPRFASSEHNQILRNLGAILLPSPGHPMHNFMRIENMQVGRAITHRQATEVRVARSVAAQYDNDDRLTTPPLEARIVAAKMLAAVFEGVQQLDMQGLSSTTSHNQHLCLKDMCKHAKWKGDHRSRPVGQNCTHILVGKIDGAKAGPALKLWKPIG